MMLSSIREFYKRHVDSAKIDKEAKIPKEVIEEMKELGLFGLTIPMQYGGLGLSTMGYARIMEEIGGMDASLSVTLAAHNSIGLKGLLLYGTEEQKQKYLPRLAKGEMIAAFALTEPSAGSDAASLQMKAELDQSGTKYVLNGTKIWISNGEIADLFTVFAQTMDPDSPTEKKITAFLVERAFGVRCGPSEHKLGIRGSMTNALYFEEVSVPKENLLGELGRGFKAAMGILNNGRLGLAAITLGACKKMIQLSVAHVNERQAFGKLIREFDQIKEKIARMMAETFALESMTYLTAAMIDRGKLDYSIEGALCKIYGSETLWMVANESLQIAAGSGYMQEYPYERLLRDSRIAMIFEGTNEILRSFVALTGMKDAGTNLKALTSILKSPLKNRKSLLKLLGKEVRLYLKKDSFKEMPARLQQANQMFAKHASLFSSLVNKALRKHGSAVVENQFIQSHLADMAITLYGLLASLSRTKQDIKQRGEQASEREIQLCTSFADLAQKQFIRQRGNFYLTREQRIRDVASIAYQDGKYLPDILTSSL